MPAVNGTDLQEYAFIRQGAFQMGCAPADRRCQPGEKPQHEVRINRDFWIGRTEVTIGAYYRYLGQNRKPKLPFWLKNAQTSSIQDHPIVNVTWPQAAAFCAWAGGRLPTEAEWEYAARGGETNRIYPFRDYENPGDKANFQGRQGKDRFDYTAPVKMFDPNSWKLYDMSGNVWEWTADWFAPDYYSYSPREDPQGPAHGREKVYRGGSFFSDPKVHLRISLRNRLQPDLYGDNIGLRCVLENSPETRNLLGVR